MAGKLLLISGVSGAGKTTLIAAALRSLPNTQYLKTFTTRPKRPGEDSSGHEYAFVDAKRYNQLRAASKKWDHTEYKGYFYGADVSATNAALKQGINVLCAVAPEPAVIKEMGSLYVGKLITIWIDTPAATAKVRIQADAERLARSEAVDSKGDFNYVFEPKGVIAVDQSSFTTFVRKLLS